jgi:hypothetical protein
MGSEVNEPLQVRFPRPIGCTSDPAPVAELVSESGLEELGAVSIGRSVLDSALNDIFDYYLF